MDSVHQGGTDDGASRPVVHSKAFRRLSLPAAVLSVALAATQLAAATPSEASTASSSRVAVGHAPALPKGAVAAAAPSASTKLTLDIELNTGHAAALTAYAEGVGNRNSPYYHQYLSPAQVAQYFGASSAEISTVESQLAAQGLTVGSVAADKMFISVSGTVAQAEHAFGVTIAGYKAAGRTFYANTTAPTLPASVSGDVAQIVGLDNVGYAVPTGISQGHLVKAPAATSATATKAGVSPNYSVNSCSQIAATYNPYGLYDGDQYYDANTLSSIYGFNSKLAAGDDGAGVTVAVFELESYDPTGVADIDSCYGHSTSVTEQKIDGGPTTGANLGVNVGSESALDIENIANLAPGVKIVDYAGPDYTTATDAQILDVFSAIFNQDTAQVVSTSWGLCEALTKYSDSSMQSEENTLFAQAAAQGQSVVAASGDNGSTACYGEDSDGTDSSVTSADDPADQPFVTGVGGTSMSGTGTPTPSVWNNSTDGSGDTQPGASGGGVSSTFSLPSYQGSATTSAPGYAANCPTGTYPSGCREVPDVSALADPYHGYVIMEYAHTSSLPAGEYFSIWGGTSGAAPVWAAVLAITDASTTCRLNGEAGFANPGLYAAGGNSSVFTDVTSGSNWVSQDGGADYYDSATGYDLASGWGTPKVSGVASVLCQAPIVSPSSYFVSTGPTRLMDTRPKYLTGPVTGPVGAGATVTLPVTGTESGVDTGVPTSNVTAVVLNVTGVLPTASGNLTVYPDGGKRPLASNLNFAANNTIANLTVVPVTDGKIDIWNNSSGTINYVVDVDGYFTTDSTASGASTYTPVTPARVADTRSNHKVGTVVGPLAGKSTTAIQVGGLGNIPASGTTAVVLNVTVTQPSYSGNIIVWPAGAPQPTASNVNYGVNQSIPNLVIVPLGSDNATDLGKIDIYNNSGGTVQYVVDVAGYFSAGTSGQKYHALGPVRLVDTRNGTGVGSVGPIGGDKNLNLPLPSNYTAVIANITATGSTSTGDLDGYGLNTTLPTVSNVNFVPGQTIPNLAIIPSNSGISVYNHSTGTTQALVDLAGYFSAS